MCLPRILGQVGYQLAQGGRVLVIAEAVSVNEAIVYLAPTLCQVDDIDGDNFSGKVITTSQPGLFPIRYCREPTLKERAVLDQHGLIC